MDNYQRLFNEIRPVKIKKGIINPNEVDFNNLVNSEWMKNQFKGMDAYKQKNYNNAISFIDKAIQENPQNSFLYNLRASYKEDLGDFNGAIEDFKKALYISGNDWYATYNQIAINYLNLKDFQNSLKAFDIAIELKINIQEEGNDEKVIPNNLYGVVMKIDYERMYTNRANVKLSLEDFGGCDEDCRKAIEINPDYTNSYVIFGLLCLRFDQKDGAYKAFKTAEDLGNKMVTGLINKFF